MPSWCPFGTPWGPLGPSWPPSDPPEVIWCHEGLFWSLQGTILSYFGSILRSLEPILVRFRSPPCFPPSPRPLALTAPFSFCFHPSYPLPPLIPLLLATSFLPTSSFQDPCTWADGTPEGITIVHKSKKNTCFYIKSY